ncbi:MAG: UDP-3-O-(3-hydroxymyristoyl)glucosamine N-acyltransferase, partial [Planctomycetaceae bacterium]|nr:UDP-3-O-(3-hydroxymyristoyl)glucosamine N-acyltransferase [Planctomycetaceae bacterium]
AQLAGRPSMTDCGHLNSGGITSTANHRGAIRSLSAGEIAAMIDGQVHGDAERRIVEVDTVERAQADHLIFVGSTKNLSRLKATAARVVIAPPEALASAGDWTDFTFIIAAEPEAAFLNIAGRLHPRRERRTLGISPLAAIDPSATIGTGTNVHPHAVIGQDVVIGADCEIHPGVVIGDGCRIGHHVTIHANSVLYSGVEVGNDVIIHAACVLGADGFGYRTVNGRHQHLPHYGIVRICDDVEIGAGTTIDRAKVGATVIGTGTRIDNQVMIGHNCQIGRHNLLVSQVGFAGSVTTGDYVVCAGQAGIADHVHLGDGAIIGAKAGVHRDMPGGQAYLGAPAAPAVETTRQMMALRRLPEFRETLKALEKEVTALREQLATQSKSEPEARSTTEGGCRAA